MMATKGIDIALLIIRIVFGASMIIGHGWGKMMRFFGDGPIQFGDPLGLGPTASLVLVVFAEVLCSVLLMVGLFSRWVTIPLIITMLTAIFIAHWGDPFGKMDKALLFLTVYVALLITGPGAYSLDAFWRNRTA